MILFLKWEMLCLHTPIQIQAQLTGAFLTSSSPRTLSLPRLYEDILFASANHILFASKTQLGF